MKPLQFYSHTVPVLYMIDERRPIVLPHNFVQYCYHHHHHQFITHKGSLILRTMMCLLGVFSDYMFLCSKYVVISLLQVAMAQKVKVKVMWVYIAPSRETTKGPFIATQLSSTRRRVELS